MTAPREGRANDDEAQEGKSAEQNASNALGLPVGVVAAVVAADKGVVDDEAMAAEAAEAAAVAATEVMVVVVAAVVALALRDEAKEDVNNTRKGPFSTGSVVKYVNTFPSAYSAQPISPRAFSATTAMHKSVKKKGKFVPSKYCSPALRSLQVA